MDFISLEMGIGFLIIFMGPIIYILIKEKSKKKKLERHIAKLCADNHIQQNLTVSLAGHILVSDTTDKKLLSYHKKQGDYSIVNLSDFDSCNVHKSWNNGEGSRKIIQNISMIFNRKKQGKPLTISIFDDSYENPLEAEAILYETDRFVRHLNTAALK